MQCPNCGNEMAFLAIACPNCGQIGFGSFIGRSIFTSEQEAKQAKALVDFLAFMFKGLFLIGSVAAVIYAIGVWLAWLTGSESVVGVFHGGLVIGKLVGITALLFLPFGIISGLVTNSTQGNFLNGYNLGQFLGPIGLIVVIFQIPNPPKVKSSAPKLPNTANKNARGRKASEKLYLFNCWKCK